jgi:hypothetical protein
VIEFYRNTGGVPVRKLRGIPYVAKEDRWSVGIYGGKSPFDLAPSPLVRNPVLTARQVSDIPAKLVADPFMIRENSDWFMFFEVLDARTGRGSIGLATSSDGMDWSYQQIVLSEPFHLSYPYVFEWHGEYYLIPESRQSGSVRLYRADGFPVNWSFVDTLLIGNYADSSIFRRDGEWWLFTEAGPGGNDTLLLFHTDDLTGSWTEHPSSPIIAGDARIARPGGRVVVLEDRIIRYAQDDSVAYGTHVWAFEITELTPTSYRERAVSASPILTASGTGWNGKGMHHIDPHQIDENEWIACVDGVREQLVVGPGY